VDFNFEKDDTTNKNIKLVFFGDKLGNIEYFEEKKLVLRELCKINGSIKEIFYYEKNSTVIVITSTLYLI